MNTNSNTNSSKKTKTVNIRCTEDTYQKLKSKAYQRNKTVSESALEYIEAGLKRNGKGVKEKGRIMVEQQQRMNDIIRQLPPQAENVRKLLEDYAERDVELWRS